MPPIIRSPKFAVAASFAFLASVAAGWMMFHQTPPMRTAVGAIEQIFVPDPAKLFGKDHLRVLLVGLDYDYDKLDQETSKSARSDIIMALNLDFKNHRVNELSVPRDMVAILPNGQRAKINQAQSDGGIQESKTVIADWLGIPSFDRYIVMRINTSKDVINAVGGVDVNVQNSDDLMKKGKNGPLDYDDNWGHLHVHLKPGVQHLDGELDVPRRQRLPIVPMGLRVERQRHLGEIGVVLPAGPEPGLDLAGGETSRLAWALAFLAMGAGSAAAFVAIRRL